MPRTLWSGTVSFGLVSVPVKLYSATTPKTVRFNQVNKDTGARIQQKRVDASTGKEVPFEAIVKGYELGPDRFVVIESEELEALAPHQTKTIDIECFVDEAEIDPMLYDASYFMGPQEGALKPYQLLVRAMEQTGRVARGHFILRSKEKIAVMRAHKGRLVLSTLVWADEVNTLPEVEAMELSEREEAMAATLVDSLTATFDHSALHDSYREQVIDLIERKAAGEEVTAVAAAPEAEPATDLMAALEASIATAPAAKVAKTAVKTKTTKRATKKTTPKAAA